MANYMSLRRFKDISSLLKNSMEAGNDMAAVEQLVDRFDEHMEKVYAPSGTLSCLDESMVKHTSTRIPSFRYLPRKPTPTGNEYHTVCDAETRVMVRVEPSRGRTEVGPVANDEAEWVHLFWK